MVNTLNTFSGYNDLDKISEVWPPQRRKAAPVATAANSPVPVTMELLNLMFVISPTSVISVHRFLILSHLAATGTAEFARDVLQTTVQVFGFSGFLPPSSRRAATTRSPTSEVCSRSPAEIAT